MLPMMAQPIVPIYNLGPSVTTLVLDGPTLGAIWVGDIVWWNDTRIEQLNNGTTFPAERILLARSNDSIAGIS
ncbi:uncharacterized protein ACA1_339710 [Acanthamoeba castellanii str. Neff]|uniref:Uncharacterized protein n=1 Tax=Acanthamoeba castellanii (strain ATCC 30010 / Neff) TaxID=1257118 RepID=L8GKI3_ACACF|nr:uncharacterized protein ACA1_339710 [Acanthamoeba castellanii str. Neff]ELR13233.1 hypothetical protein ACA1_339710 [Acanthamoeba castellanii str. Neff]